MKKCFVMCVIGTVLASGSARAEEQKLTVERCLGILGGLRALSGGYTQVVKDNGVERTVTQQFKLGPNRFSIALSIAALEVVEKATGSARNALVNEIGGGKPFDEKTPPLAGAQLAPWAIFIERLQKEVLDTTCSVVPSRLKLSDLKLGDGPPAQPDTNAIPPTAIAALMPIIDQ